MVKVLEGLALPKGKAVREAHQAALRGYPERFPGKNRVLNRCPPHFPEESGPEAILKGQPLSYFRNNVRRMKYPHYRARGWQIGPGPIESACKTVVGQRLKQAGMHWREYGTDNVCHLRAHFKSEKDQWDAFWERKVN